MKYIKDFEEGNKIRGIYYCKTKLSTETKAGKPYDSLNLQDRTGVIDTKVWEPNSPGIKEYEAGDYIEMLSYSTAQSSFVYQVSASAVKMNMIRVITCRFLPRISMRCLKISLPWLIQLRISI